MNKNQIINSIFYPRQSSIPMDEKDHIVSTFDGEKVGIRLFLKDKNLPTILFFHGNAELAQEYDDLAEFYNKFEMNFIVADYRGYGLSSGSPNKENLHEDSKAIFKYAKEYLNKNNYDDNLYIMGRSLGSCSAFEIIDTFSDSIKGCIIESGFVTEYPLLNLLQINPEEVDFNLSDGFMNLEKLKNYNGKLMVIHADLDDIIPFSQADIMMHESPSNHKELFKVNGAGHNNVIAISREEYFIKIKNFIDSNE